MWKPVPSGEGNRRRDRYLPRGRRSPDLYDTALLITGDEDFVDAIRSARRVSIRGGVNPQFGKRVIWGHFGTQAVDGRLDAACDDRYLLEDQFLRTVQRPNIRRDRGHGRR